MLLRIVFENNKYHIEQKGLLFWKKLKIKTMSYNSGNKTNITTYACREEYEIASYNTPEAAFEHVNCYIEQQVHRNPKIIIEYLEI